MTKRMTQEKIIEALGAENWEQAVAEFAWLNEDEILRDLDDMFPTEDNEEMAAIIYDAI